MKRNTLLLLLSLLVSLTAVPPARATAVQLPLTWVSPLPQGNSLNDVAYGDHGFVAVGGNAILTSADGLDWQLLTPADLAPLSGVAFGAGRYVAAGAFGQVFTSTDGRTWDKVAAGAPMEHLADVAFGQGRFVAVGNGGTVLSSTDGLTWQRHDGGGTHHFEKVAFGNDRFVATSYQGAHVIQTAGDTLQVGRPFSLGYGRTVAFGNGRFFSVGQGRTILSADGSQWDLAVAAETQSAAYAGFAGGYYFALGGGAARSVDGRRWEKLPGLLGPARAVAYGAGRFVAVGREGLIAASDDGLNWRELTRRPVPDRVNAALYAHGQWVVAGQFFHTSGDGTAWQQGRDYATWCTALAEGPDRLVCVGPGGTIRTGRPDGTGWEAVKSPTEHHLNGVTYGAGLFVAVGVGGDIVTSPDGRSWTLQEGMPISDPKELRPFLNAVTYTGKQFVAVGDRGAVLVSTDGVLWRSPEPRLFQDLQGVAAGGGLVVAVGAMGVLALSTDHGESWQAVPRAEDGDMAALAYGGGRFVAVGYSGSILTSRDGRTWTRHWLGDSHPLTTVAYGDGRFLLGGPEVLLTLAAAAIPEQRCSSGFPDVGPENPACQALAQLSARKVLGGLPDGTYQPERVMTRAEFAKVVTVGFGTAPQPEAKVRFSDVEGHWAYTMGYIQAAVAMKAISGFPDGRFAPDEPITRAQAVKILMAAAGLQPMTTEQESFWGGFTPYGDLPQGGWYTGWVKVAYIGGLIGPLAAYPLWLEPEFRGDQPLTRAEAAQLLGTMLLNK